MGLLQRIQVRQVELRSAEPRLFPQVPSCDAPAAPEPPFCNNPPSGTFIIETPDGARAGVSILFQATCADVDGTVVRYEWFFGDGTAPDYHVDTNHVFRFPGTYTVTFSLPGFSTVKREGVELNTGFTANIGAEMKVGGVEETITVSGATPVVDVQSVRSQNVLTRQVLDTLPTSKSVAAMAQITLGALQTNQSLGGGDAGGSKGDTVYGFAQIHGSQQGIRTIDGMKMSSAYNVGASGLANVCWICQR